MIFTDYERNRMESSFFVDSRINPVYIKNNFFGKKILITGAAGSIANKIIEQLIAYYPKELLLYDCDDVRLYEIFRRYSNESNCKIMTIMGNLLDIRMLEDCLTLYKPDMIIHAAANKVTPICENNVRETFQNNVITTENIFETAGKLKIPKVTFISSNEAFKPRNVFGYTKKFSEERINYYAAKHQRTIYNAVRFGLVLFSRGTVIDTFISQVMEGKDVTVGNAYIKKYVCSLKDAANAVLLTCGKNVSGEIYTVDLGVPVKIQDIAEKILQYYNKSNSIIYTGLRSGDRFEEPKADGEFGLIYTGIDNFYLTNVGKCTMDDSKNLTNIINNYKDYGNDQLRELLSSLCDSFLLPTKNP